MSATTSSHRLVDTVTISPSATEFVAYCEIEYEHRASSGVAFDELLFRSAVDFVLRKLCHLEKRGCA